MAAMMAYQWYQDQQNRKAVAKASQPQPTYLRYAWNPAQRQMYNWMSPYLAGMYGKPGTAPTATTLAGQTDVAAFEKRQYGGPVEGQAPYLVGEQGPEMFVPEQPGTVVPNQALQTGQPSMMGQHGNMPLTPRQGGGPVQPPKPGVPGAAAQPGLAGGTIPDYSASTGLSRIAPAPAVGTMPIPQQWQMGAAPAPTGDWYSNLDPNVRAGIEQPYMRGMEMLESRLQGRGALGAQKAGISGAGADVLGQYMQKAAPSMAQTGWGMMAPGLQQQQAGQISADLATQAQTWEGQTLPYKMLPSLLPYMMPQAVTSAGKAPVFPGDTTATTTTAGAGASAQYPYGTPPAGWKGSQTAWERQQQAMGVKPYDQGLGGDQGGYGVNAGYGGAVEGGGTAI